MNLKTILILSSLLSSSVIAMEQNHGNGGNFNNNFNLYENNEEDSDEDSGSYTLVYEDSQSSANDSNHDGINQLRQERRALLQELRLRIQQLHFSEQQLQLREGLLELIDQIQGLELNNQQIQQNGDLPNGDLPNGDLPNGDLLIQQDAALQELRLNVQQLQLGEGILELIDQITNLTQQIQDLAINNLQMQQNGGHPNE